jgi:RecB family endonuclease NucS
MTERPPVWQMVREAIDHLGGVATYGAIRDFIKEKYGAVNESMITCQIIICSVNHPSRIHYPENKKPRSCNSQYDFLFNTGRGRVEAYNPDAHGQWEIRRDEYEKLVVAVAEESSVEEASDLLFPLESHLRDFIAANLATVRPQGLALRLYEDPTGRDGVEYQTDVGPIDILAQDSNDDFVVFELKLSKGPDRAVGQVLRYMGWVSRHLAGSKKVLGVIVAREIDEKLKYAVSLVPSIVVLEYKVRFDLRPVSLH